MTIPKTPLLTVDTIIELNTHPERPIVLIERGNPPYGWALPGGFVDSGERVENAAIREAGEETGLSIQLKFLLGIYSAPDRDPRGPTVSIVYVATALGTPHAGDDARTIGVYPLNAIPDALAFDHKLILEDYKRFIKTGTLVPLRYN